MASLNQAWNIATGALAADQSAISVVAGNIANANTPGYTTESVQWGSADTVTVNGHSVGTGVALEGTVSQRDRLLNQRINQQTQDQSAAAERLAALNDLQSLFSGAISATGGTSSSGAADIGQQMTAFFQSFSSLAADPSNATLRAGVLSAAQSLAATFNQVSGALEQQQSGLDATIASAAGQVNSLTSDIASLNAKISASSPNGDAGTLEDQRQYDLQQLSQLVGIHQITNENNGLTITTSSGAVLVAGGQSVDLTTQSSGGMTHLLLGGADQTSALTNAGGQIGGALEARDSDIPSAISSIDQLAWNVGTAVNTQQASGIDANGASGAPIFGLGGSATGAANAISVLLTDPNGVAASSRGRLAGWIKCHSDGSTGIGVNCRRPNAEHFLRGPGREHRCEGKPGDHYSSIAERFAHPTPVPAKRVVLSQHERSGSAPPDLRTVLSSRRQGLHHPEFGSHECPQSRH